MRLVQLAQSFHQQTLGVQGCGFLGGLSVEVNLEATLGPAQNFEDRLVAGDGAICGVFHLALMEVHLALIIGVGHGERTTLAAHFKRLHQIHDIHLRKAAAQDAVGGRGFGHFLECDAIDHALDPLSGLLQKKWLLDIVFGGLVMRKPFIDVGFAGHEDDRHPGSGGAALEFFEQLAAVHAGHAVVADNHVGSFVHRFQQGIGGVAGGGDFGQRRKGLLEHAQHHGVVVHQQDFYVARHRKTYLRLLFLLRR